MVENKPGTGIDAADPPLVYAEAVEGGPPTEVPPKPKDEWTCPQCTLINPARKLYCIACFHRHPDLSPGNVGCQEYDNDDGPSAPSQEHDDGEGEGEDDDREDDVSDDRHVVERDLVTRTAEDGGFAYSHNVITVHAEEDPFHKKIRRRVRRKKRMAAGGAAGLAVGIIAGAPALAVAGVVGGAVAARVASKHREKLKDERVAMRRYEIETKGQARVEQMT